ncbi:EAL domain-containing protein [Leptolyngbya cf. ectocarpi LEGE 11479]|uniref:EAL domain-containing protein n=1 Tax=Leptolyngbya cf. ectocarpi LEGE 11479 TaxID=1828722 RepID=A0A928ZUU0_LEPEC|nr:EAL domain-containing response regulator [Leptolyngbya ectocarpi]MBE9067849.1 EAL domain-containing protein [Leptolyngbya cf. ectocarpi LEGE 11479]
MYPINADTAETAVQPKACGPSKILIVDDVPSNLRLLSTALDQAGYNVRNAIDGTVAMMSIAAEMPDLILLDIRMPDLDGFAVCRQLHGNAITADIPVIFMSALDELPDKLRAFSLGAVDYITKPFQIAEVLVRIEHQLELRRLRQALKAQNQKLRIILRQYEVAETQIHQINQELEQRVFDRTKELNDTNHNLQQEIRERQQAQAKLMYLAMHDALTGLPNRTLLMKRLEGTVETSQSALYQWSALLMLDCDRFKTINDTLGHLRGDRLLIEIANRITAMIPDDSFAARLTDDKFAILLPPVSDPSAILRLVQGLQQSLGEPIELGDHEVTVSANVGIVLVEPSYRQAEHVLRDGSLALIQAKQKPQGWLAFQPEMHEQALHRLTLEGKLRQALRQEQLQIFYQPIVALAATEAAGPIVGYEALVRWQPEGTSDFLSPADFIPLAEESDLISQLGNWVFLTVCEQLKQWQQDSPSTPVPFVSVNFSVRHLQDEQFSQQIHAVLQQTQVQPSWLKFEITENLLIGDSGPVLRTLDQLRRWGIQISIDDFGTGYSSLSYLKQLPVDTLKIDRAFIKDIESNYDNFKIIEAIIKLAQALKLDVVAEGIETEWQAQQLINLGCNYGQGYWFSQPLDSQAVGSLLKD